MWRMARAVSPATRLRRIEELAHDLARDLARGGASDRPTFATIHREMADAIRTEIDQVIRALSNSP
jgi:hypothetical protein